MPRIQPSTSAVTVFINIMSNASNESCRVFYHLHWQPYTSTISQIHWIVPRIPPSTSAVTVFINIMSNASNESCRVFYHPHWWPYTLTISQMHWIMPRIPPSTSAVISIHHASNTLNCATYSTIHIGGHLSYMPYSDVLQACSDILQWKFRRLPVLM